MQEQPGATIVPPTADSVPESEVVSPITSTEVPTDGASVAEAAAGIARGTLGSVATLDAAPDVTAVAPLESQLEAWPPANNDTSQTNITDDSSWDLAPPAASETPATLSVDVTGTEALSQETLTTPESPAVEATTPLQVADNIVDAVKPIPFPIPAAPPAPSVPQETELPKAA